MSKNRQRPLFSAITCHLFLHSYFSHYQCISFLHIPLPPLHPHLTALAPSLFRKNIATQSVPQANVKKKKTEIVTLKSFVQASIYMVKKAELTATLWRLEGILSFRQDSCTSKSGCLRQLKNGFLSYPGQHREGIVCGSAQHKV